jgi:transposase
MQASNASTLTTEHCGTIFVAIELSQRSWLVTIHSPDRDRFSHHKMSAGDDSGLLALIGRVRERAQRVLGYAPAVVELLRGRV